MHRPDYFAMAEADELRQAHRLLDRLEARQLAAVVHLLGVMTDPVTRGLAAAAGAAEPMLDEPPSEDESRALEAAQAWLKDHIPISHRDVLAKFNLASEDFS